MAGSEKFQFNDLHFVEEGEASTIVARLLENRKMLDFLKIFNIRINAREYVKLLKQVCTVTDIQQLIMRPIFKQIFEKTSDGISQTGIETVPSTEGVVYLSNHRDIILDSGTINMLLSERGGRFCSAGIGDNLLINPLVNLVFQIMKCFVVKRSLTGKEQVIFLKQLSNYVAYSVLDRATPVWLAHGSGRAKDGIDRTNPAIIRMLSLAGGKDPVSHLQSLKIVTTACSYEWDPCDVLKVKERLVLASGKPFIKAKDDDFLNIQKGICGFKGGIHISFSKLTEEDLETCRDLGNRERLGQLSSLVDAKIHEGYRLWPSNYIAADLHSGSDEFAEHYDADAKEEFIERLNKRLKFDADTLPTARRLFLEGYANPVFSRQKLTAAA